MNDPTSLLPGLHFVHTNRLTYHQALVFSTLLTGPRTTKEICEALGIQRSYAHAAMNRLIDKGVVMVVRKRDAYNKKQLTYAAFLQNDEGGTYTVA